MFTCNDLNTRNTYDGVQYQPQKNRKPYLKIKRFENKYLLLDIRKYSRLIELTKQDQYLSLTNLKNKSRFK